MLLNEQLSMGINGTPFATHEGVTGSGVQGYWLDTGRVDDITCANELLEGPHALFLRGLL